MTMLFTNVFKEMAMAPPIGCSYPAGGISDSPSGK